LNKQILRALAFVALALSTTNCEKSNGTIGSGKFVDDRPELGEKLVFPVISYTTAWDSIVTSSPSRAALGNMQDPIFGSINSSFSTRILLSKINPDFGDSTICDSVKVRLAYNATYGPTGGQMHLQMAPLINPLYDTVRYYSNQVPVTADPIADTVLTLDPDQIVYNGVDSLVRTLSFDADPAYFQSVIFDAAINGDAHFADNEEFVLEVPGLQFRDVSTSGNSATGYFDLSSGGSIIQLYYHTGSNDTVPKIYTLTFGQNFGDPARVYNQFIHDFSGAAFDTAAYDSINGEMLSYVQGGCGARTILEIQGLDTLIGKGYSINRADMTVHVLQGTASPYTLPGTLLLLENYDSTQALIKDYTSSINPAGGAAYRADIREYRYRFYCTRMVHEMVNERENVVPLILATSAANSNVHRVVLGGGMHPAIPVEFNVYYTKSD
jgi:hypothetical protein